MPVVLLLSKTVTSFADMMRLKGNALILRFSKLLIILVLCCSISPLSNPFLAHKILLDRFQLMPLPFTEIFLIILITQRKKE